MIVVGMEVFCLDLSFAKVDVLVASFYSVLLKSVCGSDIFVLGSFSMVIIIIPKYKFLDSTHSRYYRHPSRIHAEKFEEGRYSGGKL